MLVTHSKFETMIAACVIGNVLVMSTDHYKMNEYFFYLSELINNGFSAIFFIECALKLHALGWEDFSTSNSNLFDLFLVFTSVVGVLLEYLFKSLNPTFLRLLRIFRIGRVLRLWKGSEGLRILIETIANCLPLLGNIGILLFLVFFIFACAGVESFGRVGCTPSMPCEGFDNRYAHFKDFPSAMLTLFRICTGDNANAMYADAMRVSPQCDDSAACKANCCVMTGMTPLFFLSFVVLTQFLITNASIAMLLEEIAFSKLKIKLENEEAARQAEAEKNQPELEDMFAQLMNDDLDANAAVEAKAAGDNAAAACILDEVPAEEEAPEEEKKDTEDQPEEAVVLPPLEVFDFNKKELVSSPMKTANCEAYPVRLRLWALQDALDMVLPGTATVEPEASSGAEQKATATKRGK